MKGGDDRDELVVELLTRIIARLDGIEEEIGKKANGVDPRTVDEAARKAEQTLGPVLERSATRAMTETAQESEERTVKTIEREIRLANSLLMGDRHRRRQMEWSILGLSNFSSLLLGGSLVGWFFIATEGAEFADRLALPGIAKLICSTAGGEIGDHAAGGEVCWFIVP